MRLRCTAHDKRVLVFRGENDNAIVAHRSGTIQCDSAKVVIGKHEMTPQSIIEADEIFQRTK